MTDFPRPVNLRCTFLSILLLKISVCRLASDENEFFSINAIWFWLKSNEVSCCILDNESLSITTIPHSNRFNFLGFVNRLINSFVNRFICKNSIVNTSSFGKLYPSKSLKKVFSWILNKPISISLIVRLNSRILRG